MSHVNHLSIMGDILASCADNGSLILTNLNTSRQDFLCNHECELKKLMFLDPHKCLVACDARGSVLFFTI
jgi:WD40 repeat protein